MKHKYDIDGDKDRGKDSEPTVHGRVCMHVNHIRMCVNVSGNFSNIRPVVLKLSCILCLFHLVFIFKQLFSLLLKVANCKFVEIVGATALLHVTCTLANASLDAKSDL